MLACFRGRAWLGLLAAVTGEGSHRESAGIVRREGLCLPKNFRQPTFPTFVALCFNNSITGSPSCCSVKEDDFPEVSAQGRGGADPFQPSGANVSVGALVNLCEKGHLEEALKTMELLDGKSIGAYTTHRLYRILQECIKYKHLSLGRRVHSIVLRRGLQSTNFLGTHLMRMFAVCGSLWEAEQVFRGLPAPDVQAWAVIISASAKGGQNDQALKWYFLMRRSCVKPNAYVFVAALQACRGAAALAAGNLILGHIWDSGVEANDFICGALIDMYSKCGSLADALQVFEGSSTKHLVSWTAMTMAYLHQGYAQKALQFFEGMRHQGICPDRMILSSLLKACCSVMALDLGKLIHADIMKLGLQSNVFLGSSLIAMYAKCGDMGTAHQVFEKLSTRNVVSWNAIISGYMQNGNAHEAFLLFQQMEAEGVAPDKVTFSTILKACASIAALPQGRMIHARITAAGCESDPFICSTLIDMYAKCGSIQGAETVFRNCVSPTKDIVVWTAMISGHAQHGSVHEALRLFQQLLREGIEPTSVTFLSLLSACSRAGLMEEGNALLQSMSTEFGVLPEKEHYACVVDLLCRAGHLYEAEEVMKNLPLKPDAVMWLSVLSACQTHVQVELGRRAFESILRLDVMNTAAYVMMSNIYAAAGNLEEKMEVRNQMLMAGVSKDPGRTWMELDSKVHAFVVEDQYHPERKQIYETLHSVVRQISRHVLLSTEEGSLSMDCRG